MSDRGSVLMLLRSAAARACPSPEVSEWAFIFSAAGLMSWSLYGEQVSRPFFITLQTTSLQPSSSAWSMAAPLCAAFVAKLVRWSGRDSARRTSVTDIHGVDAEHRLS